MCLAIFYLYILWEQMMIKNRNVKPATSHTGVTMQTTLINRQTLTFKNHTSVTSVWNINNYNTIIVFLK
jgi:hypothetical protein